MVDVLEAASVRASVAAPTLVQMCVGDADGNDVRLSDGHTILAV
jgi:hypothetical protein